MEHISKQLALRIPDTDPKVPSYVWAFAAGVVLFTFMIFTGLPDTKSKEYNVIIVAFDGLQAQHLSAYGYERNTTPNLDQFFTKSYLMTNAISPSSWTLPTYMSIFTSLYPSEHDLTNKFKEIQTSTSTTVIESNVDLFRPHTIRLAQILKEAGYDTAAFTGGDSVSAKYGYGKGFDIYYETPTFGGFEDTAKKAAEWLDEHKDNKMFLFLHGYDVHGQNKPSGGLDFRYVDTPYTGPFKGTALNQRNLRERGLAEDPILLTPQSEAFWNAIYDEKIARADTEFGKFMKTVEYLGLYENSIIITLSDHGTEVYEHKKFDHGHTLYSELLNVLFAIHVPQQEEGKRITSLVSTLDVTPTILSLLGLTHSAQQDMNGIDLSDAFEGKDVSRSVFSETDYRLYTHKRSVTRPDGWKFILTRETGMKELYYLKGDPHELKNLVSVESQISNSLNEELENHFKSMGDTGPWVTGCLAVYDGQCK